MGQANIEGSLEIVHAFSSGGFDLGVLPGGLNSRAFARANGITIGESESFEGLRGFIYSNGTMRSLGTGSAKSISPDGLWIFGTGFNGNPYIWDSQNGARDLMQVLLGAGVNGIGNWSSIGVPDTVLGDSINGYVLTGTGSNGRYIIRGLFAVPEPQLLVLSCFAAVTLVLTRRFSQANRK